MMGDGKAWIFCQTGAWQAPIVYFFITIHCQISSGLMRDYLNPQAASTAPNARRKGFRRITYFLDRPDVMTRYTRCASSRQGEMPAPLVQRQPSEAATYDEGRHYAVWHDPFPKPSYLFALVGGDLGLVRDSFTTMSGREVELHLCRARQGRTARGYAMDALKRSMKWDEEMFGREYDLDIFMIVAVSDFNMGAMENKGLNVFNDKYVLADVPNRHRRRLRQYRSHHRA
jgi:aminopeptidase N